MNAKLAPVANILVRANDAFTTLEGMLIAEIAAGNANAGTPMAAVSRVAFGIAWTAVRVHVLPKLSGSRSLRSGAPSVQMQRRYTTYFGSSE